MEAPWIVLRVATTGSYYTTNLQFGDLAVLTLQIKHQILLGPSL